MDDIRPFPIMMDMVCYGEPPKHRCTIPWWLAEEAYKYYVEKFGSSQSLQQLADRGGFGRNELLMLLRKDIHF
jgi:hypothetical protein